MTTRISNRNQAQAEWPTLLPDRTIYKVDGQLWTGQNTTEGNDRYINLTPLTEQERQYLDKRGVLKGLEK